MLYLASPYSHRDPKVMQERFEVAEQVTAHLLNSNVWVYSPIVHCHALSQKYKLPTNFGFWRDYNYSILRLAEALWVIDMDGWRTSQGVTDELNFARTCRIETYTIDPNTFRRYRGADQAAFAPPCE
jgi:hypothetical protein